MNRAKYSQPADFDGGWQQRREQQESEQDLVAQPTRRSFGHVLFTNQVVVLDIDFRERDQGIAAAPVEPGNLLLGPASSILHAMLHFL